MSLMLSEPTMNQLLSALRDAIVADAASPTGLLPATLSPYGIALDVTTPSATDPLELSQVKIGSRGNLPPGLSIFFFPGRKSAKWFASENERQADYIVHVQGYWTDPPSGGPFLTQTPRLLWSLFPDLAESLEVVLGPENLGAFAGTWDVPNSQGSLMNPICKTANACAWVNATIEARQEIVYFCDVVWSGFKTY